MFGNLTTKQVRALLIAKDLYTNIPFGILEINVKMIRLTTFLFESHLLYCFGFGFTHPFRVSCLENIL